MLISHLTFKSGLEPGAGPTSVQLTPITVIIGPNNSGKSLALREILQAANAGGIDGLILSKATFPRFSAEEATQIAEQLKADDPEQASLRSGQIRVGRFRQQSEISQDVFRDCLTGKNGNDSDFCHHYARHRVLSLSGAGRLTLTNDTQIGNLLGRPQNPLERMFQDDDRRAKWREIVYKGLNLYPALSILANAQIQIRTSKHIPDIDVEKTYLPKSVEYHRSSVPMESNSDGVKAFIGTLLQVMAGDKRDLVLIDEPEAFLHPTLAYSLGRELTKYLTGKPADSRGQLIVSTHSPNFLMGCIAAKAPVSVLRLTYDGGQATTRSLKFEELALLMRRPILRSANAMAGLFYKSAVVGEADADRAFYQEINERLLAQETPEGIEDSIFVNANGKDTVPDLIKPLRDLGVPAAAVVDIDVFKEGRTCWTKHLEAVGVPDADRAVFELSRAKAHALLSAKTEKYQTGGIELLAGGERETVENLIARLAEYGMFVVPLGECERWLPELDVSRAKPNWLREIFDKLGEDPNASDYVLPAQDDVWNFVRKIRAWISNPSRKGM